MSLLFILLITLLPSIVIGIYVYRKDKYEKEPIKLLLTNFGLGATASIILTFILSAVSKLFFSVTDPLSILQQFIKAFMIVALVEELSKYLIVRYVAQKNPEFNEPFDGIVYAVMVSMGFAAVENIAYVAEGGLPTALVRAFTAVPAHAVFGILMGVIFLNEIPNFLTIIGGALILSTVFIESYMTNKKE